MVTRKAIASILEDYEDIVVATVCSHSSLQIFHGARQEGFRTLGIAIGQRPRFYDAFSLAKPDRIFIRELVAGQPRPADRPVAPPAGTGPPGPVGGINGPEGLCEFANPTSRK